MPGVALKRTQYFTLDTDEISLKTKENGAEVLYPAYRGYLVDVNYREDTYKGKPANKYEFVFTDGEGNREVVQSGEGSVFSSALINRLLSIDGQYGEYILEVYQSKGGYIVPKIKEPGAKETLDPYFSLDEFNHLAKTKAGGDKTKLTYKLWETMLKPKLASQGTVKSLSETDSSEGADLYGEPSGAVQTGGGEQDGDQEEVFDDLDDDLPF